MRRKTTGEAKGEVGKGGGGRQHPHRVPKKKLQINATFFLFLGGENYKLCTDVVFFPSFSFSSCSLTQTHTHTHTPPNAYKLGGVLISLTHEASFRGHQLTEAGLGRDGAQEVSHCPAAEPAASVLQSLPPSFPPIPPFLPFLSFLSFHLSCSSLSTCILSVVFFFSISLHQTPLIHCSSLQFFRHWSL